MSSAIFRSEATSTLDDIRAAGAIHHMISYRQHVARYILYLIARTYVLTVTYVDALDATRHSSNCHICMFHVITLRMLKNV